MPLPSLPDRIEKQDTGTDDKQNADRFLVHQPTSSWGAWSATPVACLSGCMRSSHANDQGGHWSLVHQLRAEIAKLPPPTVVINSPTDSTRLRHETASASSGLSRSAIGWTSPCSWSEA